MGRWRSLLRALDGFCLSLLLLPLLLLPPPPFLAAGAAGDRPLQVLHASYETNSNGVLQKCLLAYEKQKEQASKNKLNYASIQTLSCRNNDLLFDVDKAGNAWIGE
ncbi:hypothetical protein E2320_020497 [Naja naja]|nr:hypothetical protein E2320_020497 [Naja naja]